MRIKTQKRSVLNIRMDGQDRSQLAKLAEWNGLTESAIARLAIRRFIQQPELIPQIADEGQSQEGVRS